MRTLGLSGLEVLLWFCMDIFDTKSTAWPEKLPDLLVSFSDMISPIKPAQFRKGFTSPRASPNTIAPPNRQTPASGPINIRHDDTAGPETRFRTSSVTARRKRVTD